MQPLAEPVSRLIDAFAQLPGIGPKTASRWPIFCVAMSQRFNLKALEELKANTLSAASAPTSPTETRPVCDDAQRNYALICVVGSRQTQAIERTANMPAYHAARRHLSGRGVNDELKIAELLQRIQAGGSAAPPDVDPPMPRIDATPSVYPGNLTGD